MEVYKLLPTYLKNDETICKQWSTIILAISYLVHFIDKTGMSPIAIMNRDKWNAVPVFNPLHGE